MVDDRQNLHRKAMAEHHYEQGTFHYNVYNMRYDQIKRPRMVFDEHHQYPRR